MKGAKNDNWHGNLGYWGFGATEIMSQRNARRNGWGRTLIAEYLVLAVRWVKARWGDQR
jgi:hypothetical protein